MATITVRNWKNEPVRELELLDAVFAIEPSAAAVHETVRAQRAEQRAGTHKTKVRGEVAGAGKKLWKQKHTGRARMGSIRSPLWRKGGTVHGPVPRDYAFKVNVKTQKLALRSALAEKISASRLVVLDRIEPGEPKAKWLETALRGLGIEGKALLVDVGGSVPLGRASANNPRLKTARAGSVRVYDVVDAEYVVASEDAAIRLQEVLQ